MADLSGYVAGHLVAAALWALFAVLLCRRGSFASHFSWKLTTFLVVVQSAALFGDACAQNKCEITMHRLQHACIYAAYLLSVLVAAAEKHGFLRGTGGGCLMMGTAILNESLLLLGHPKPRGAESRGHDLVAFAGLMAGSAVVGMAVWPRVRVLRYLAAWFSAWKSMMYCVLAYYFSPDSGWWGHGAPTRDEHRDIMVMHTLVGLSAIALNFALAIALNIKGGHGSHACYETENTFGYEPRACTPARVIGTPEHEPEALL
mmetsp:Transcript_58332/g.162565  ORF Transcript_58332/g.162565 Transcript_58332/m.162565 type:complete len:260 (+) Transcript_58332:96-875(+)